MFGKKIKKSWLRLTDKRIKKKWIIGAGMLFLVLFILWRFQVVDSLLLTTDLVRLIDRNDNGRSRQELLTEEDDAYGEVRSPQNNKELRDQILFFIRQVVENYYSDSDPEVPDFFEKQERWLVKATLYSKGEVIGRAERIADGLFSSVLKEVVVETLESGGVSEQEAGDSRFVIEVGALDGEIFSLVEYEGRAEELKGEVIPVRRMTRGLLEQNIVQSKEYLFRVVHPEQGGVYKYYYPQQDKFDNSLRTTYTSTLFYSLLKINDFQSDKRVEELTPKITDFLFSMQETEKQKAIGAFHYSLDLEKNEKDYHFVVGTNSKTIYTLIELYKKTGEEKYLNAARKSADWLLTMQDPDGSMKSYIRYDNEEWYHSAKYSVLYNGQVLSALSRIYRVTGEEKYLTGAGRIADNFRETVEKQGCYVGDDYRTKNPISSSWLVMSLLDYYLASGQESYKDIVFECSNDLLKRQLRNENDILGYGRWPGAYSTSGNGWICEVFSEVYNFCREQGRENCSPYKEAVVKSARWIIERTYTPANSYWLDNDRALGGAFWNRQERYVRTDSVAHAVNGYVNVIGELDEGVIFYIPEAPYYQLLEER